MEVELSAALIDGSDGQWAPRRVLGVRVRPFSLWHRLVLNSIDSPFMREGVVTLRDLRIAVGICRSQFRDSRVQKPRWIPTLIHGEAILGATASGIGFLFGKRIRRTPGRLTRFQEALRPHVNDFLEYCGDYLQEPEFVVIPKQNNTPRVPRGRAPDEFEHACELIRMGFPEERAWNMPVGLARWYRLVFWRAQGVDVDVTTEQERAFQESLPEEYRWNLNGINPPLT